MFIRNHIITRPMCPGRLFYRVGWSKTINNVGNTLHLYKDLYNSDASFINGAAVLTKKALVDGWAYGIADVLLPEVSKYTDNKTYIIT